ncbi:hypothetical protein B0H13DRAFT_1663605, partial [Mycena leptocephala]
NIQSLLECRLPCGVDWKQTEDGESNNVATATSMHDTGDEEGTSSGPCSFAVFGLTGEECGLAAQCCSLRPY